MTELSTENAAANGDSSTVNGQSQLADRIGLRLQHDGTAPMDEAQRTIQHDPPGTGDRAKQRSAVVTVNEPQGSVLLPDLQALVRAREVLYFLTWRDVKVRYKQTAIGAVRSWVTTVLATNLNFQWLGNAFSHLMKLPLPLKHFLKTDTAG